MQSCKDSNMNDQLNKILLMVQICHIQRGAARETEILKHYGEKDQESTTNV